MGECEKNPKYMVGVGGGVKGNCMKSCNVALLWEFLTFSSLLSNE